MEWASLEVGGVFNIDDNLFITKVNEKVSTMAVSGGLGIRSGVPFPGIPFPDNLQNWFQGGSRLANFKYFRKPAWSRSAVPGRIRSRCRHGQVVRSVICGDVWWSPVSLANSYLKWTHLLIVSTYPTFISEWSNLPNSPFQNGQWLDYEWLGTPFSNYSTIVSRDSMARGASTVSAYCESFSEVSLGNYSSEESGRHSKD